MASETVTFRPYTGIIVTIIGLSILFLLLSFWIILAISNQTRNQVVGKTLLVRRLLALLLSLAFTIASVGAAFALSAERIEVTDQYLKSYALFSHQEVAWSDVASVDANFIPTTSLGLWGRSSYAWVDLKTQQGNLIHVSLRFMEGTRKLEEFIYRKVPSFHQSL